MNPYSKSTRRQWREQIKARGFSKALDHSEIAAAAEIILAGVARASRTRPASAAMRQIYEIVERSTKNHDQVDRLACKAGCNFCCHQFVSASPPEIFYLARMIEGASQSETQKSALTQAAAELANVPSADIVKHETRCGLLTDMCSVYPARPFSCRGYNSEDVELCKKWLLNRDIGIPINRQHINFANKAKVAMWAALKFSGLPKRSYELNEALLTVFATPDAETRWLGGEPIFDGVKFDEFDDPKATVLVDKIISLLKQAGVERAS